jgi:mRNA interferase MazF
LVEFDPTRGHEIRKTRPAVIIQNDIGNQHSPITIVAAVTSTILPHPVMVPVAPTKGNGLVAPSAIHLGQIRSIDRGRLVKRLGALDVATIDQVDAALTVSLGFASF